MNKQKALRPDHNEAGHISVHSIWSSIQGEGPFAGRPALFIRLHGCNLQCPRCDTDYTSNEYTWDPYVLAGIISNFRESLVILTGGEPFRQNIGPFTQALLQQGREVQVETNGTLYLANFPYERVSIVCSPKSAVSPFLLPHISAWKYILQAERIAPDGLPTSTMGRYCKVARPPDSVRPCDVFVQPLDEGNPERNQANLQATVESCQKFGYRLSLQLHKILGLP